MAFVKDYFVFMDANMASLLARFYLGKEVWVGEGTGGGRRRFLRKVKA